MSTLGGIQDVWMCRSYSLPDPHDTAGIVKVMGAKIKVTYNIALFRQIHTWLLDEQDSVPSATVPSQ